METTDLFIKLQESKKKIIILQGGGDAGKTVTALQYLGVECVKHPGIIVTVTGQDLPNLKRGALVSFDRYALPYLKDYGPVFNKSETTYTFANGSVIEFKSFKDEMDARGSVREYLFINEANSTNYNMFWQLERKTRTRVILDYNPTAPFWVHANLLEGGERQYQGTFDYFQLDHRHNPFLSQADHDRYENISDPELFEVYARGNTGKITGLILGHFKKVDKMPECDRYVWGIDYGYTNDKTAIVRMGVIGRKRYFQEVCYLSGKEMEEQSDGKVSIPMYIKNKLVAYGWQAGQPIYSEHDAEMILQLRKIGVPIKQAKKGPGSKVAGIAKLREYECFYIGANYEKEIMNYKYVKVIEQITGKEIVTNEPQDGNDHLCDAGRYACYTDSFINRSNIIA